MKRDWVQILTLALCVVLLIVTVLQGRKLESLREDVNRDFANLEQSLENVVHDISRRTEQSLENAEKIVKEYSLTPIAVDSINKIVTAEIILELKQWQEGAVVTLIVSCGEAELLQELTVDASGVCRGQITVPFEKEHELLLSALLTSGGERRREQIGGWGSVSMLLPLQHSGGGWTGPEYRDGRLFSDFSVSVDQADWYRGAVLEPVFRIYRNGELVQELEAVGDAYGGGYVPADYDDHNKDGWWGIECKSGDTIEIRLICKDEFGLSYDFHFQSWEISPEGLPKPGTASGGAIVTS